MSKPHALALFARDTGEKTAPCGQGCVYYDGNCAFCSDWVGYWQKTLAKRSFCVAPLQAEGSHAKLKLSDAELLNDLRLLTEKGEVISGADVYLHVMRRIWWAWPLYLIFSMPGFNYLLHRGYRTFANNRYCISGACRVPKPSRFIQYAPLIHLTVGSILLTRGAPAWVGMWSLVFAVFAASKWLTFWPARKKFPNAGRAAAYLFLWPGMDIEPFCHPAVPVVVSRLEYASAFAQFVFGIALMWFLIPILPHSAPMLIGWMGMAALIFMLHFGLLRLLALAWQHLGINVHPVMRAPALATGLSDFWGARWNTAFRDLAHRAIFAPMQKRAGIRAATFAVFAASGLVHDLVISVPARAGYGLPTLYFLIQALGVTAERSALGKRLGLQRRIAARVYTCIFVLGPAALLFHRPFVDAVMLPFLRAIRAL
jgi:predicted DCC family thiol-disulfide oxidoreductase YuxK